MPQEQDQDQDQNQNETSQDPNEQQQNGEQDEHQQQPTPIQTATGPTDDEIARQKRYIELLEATTREQNAQLRQMREAPREPTPPPQPQRTPEELREEFYNNPKEATRGVIREELRETVAPLIEFVNQMKGQTVLGELKNRFKVNPAFASQFTPDIEATVDTIMNRLPPDQWNEANMQSAVVHAIGLKAIGQLPGQSQNGTPEPTRQQNGTPAPQNNQQAPVVNNPPHMRPSSAPQPNRGPGGGPKLRPLTENEERLRREQGFSHKEFLDWLEVPIDRVVTSKIGKEAK